MILLILIVLTVMQQVPAASCTQIQGTFQSKMVQKPGCKGICTEGSLAGSLSGRYSFDQTGTATSKETSAPPTLQFFIGSSTVNLANGVLLGVDTGAFDQGTGNLASLVTWKGGEGPYASATGQIRVQGAPDPSGMLKGDYAGTLCGVTRVP